MKLKREEKVVSIEHITFIVRHENMLFIKFDYDKDADDLFFTDKETAEKSYNRIKEEFKSKSISTTEKDNVLINNTKILEMNFSEDDWYIILEDLNSMYLFENSDIAELCDREVCFTAEDFKEVVHE